MTGAALARLLQLASPMLPVGAYSYSQGIEPAVDARIVFDAPSAEAWIGDVLDLSIGGFEAPVLLRLLAAWERDDREGVRHWNELFIASRESAELRAETLQMGYSLRRLLQDLPVEGAGQLDAFEEICWPAAFAFAAHAWGIPAAEALAAYAFGWCENQVAAALKAVPLGQTDGQRVLMRVAARIPAIVEAAGALRDEDLRNSTPGLALLSSLHETQYSRIFRS
ncbi:MAG TPA: urease accessory UreF family protein [Usitatibacter sp.]|nr:urease accessory UreF family protein [Usitatibacter sp.]